MNLSCIRVVNYRGLRDVSMPLSRFVCITGENNGGKSSVLQALSLFLSGSSLKPSDYFDPSSEITIHVTISDITDDDLALLSETHRNRIAPLVQDGKLTLVRRYNLDGKSQLGTMEMRPKDIRFAEESISELVARKSGEELRTAVVGEFPELEEQRASITTQAIAKQKIQELANSLPPDLLELKFVTLPTGFDRSILPMLPEKIYIPAVKDLSDETKTAESSSFGKILAIVLKTIEPLLADDGELFERLSKKLTRIVASDGSTKDERLPEIQRIESTIQRFVRESFANVSIEIEIPPPELKSILSTARILANDGISSPLELKGDGLRRAVVFSILRSYVELSRAVEPTDTEANPLDRGYLLLFEEPELFLHPDAQKILFDALGTFAKQNHVIVTTHSPLFLGPDTTATFVRLAKHEQTGVDKPFTKAYPVDLGEISPRDAFQIICYENNNAAFFAKRVVLVEGDSDQIVFPYIAEMLNPQWNSRAKSVAFVRVSGKGSIGRYRSFFGRFDVPVYVITDLDTVDEGFDKLDPSEQAKSLRIGLIQKADAVTATLESSHFPKSSDIRDAQAKPEIRQLWEAVRSARAAFEADNTKFPELEAAVSAFFAWEKKNIRRECIRKAEEAEVRESKLALIWELRKQKVFVLERGALDDYYPPEVTGHDKPSKAQSLRTVCSDRETVLLLSPQQECPNTGRVQSEFEFVFSSIFE